MNKLAISLILSCLAVACVGLPDDPGGGTTVRSAAWVEPVDPGLDPYAPDAGIAECTSLNDQCGPGLTCEPTGAHVGYCRACGVNTLPELATCTSSKECDCGTTCAQAWDGRNRCVRLCDLEDGDPACKVDGTTCKSWVADLGTCTF